MQALPGLVIKQVMKHDNYSNFVFYFSIIIKKKTNNKKQEFVCLVLILQRIDYLTYLETFDRLFDIPKEKKNPEYRRLVVGITVYVIISVRGFSLAAPVFPTYRYCSVPDVFGFDKHNSYIYL